MDPTRVLRLLLTLVLGWLVGIFQPSLDVAEPPLCPPRILRSVPSVVLLADRDVHLSSLPARGPLVFSRTRARNDCDRIGCSICIPAPFLESRCLPDVSGDLVLQMSWLVTPLLARLVYLRRLHRRRRR